MNKVNRGMKVLERLKARTGMSEEGMQWLVAVLDPSHDEKLECCGYPDRNVGPSVLQVVKSSYDIVQPVWTQANSQWGFHIWLDDYLMNDTYANGAFVTVENQNYTIDVTQVPTNLYPVGGLIAVAFNETINQLTDITRLPPSGGGNKNVQLLGDPINSSTDLNAGFLQGKLRKIAESFEVCNTTAELYRGGSVAVYEQPTSKNDATAFYVQSTNAALDPEVVKKWGAENIFIERPMLIEKEVLLEHVHCDQSLSPMKKEKKVDEYTPLRYYVVEKSGIRTYLDKFLVPVSRVTVQTMAIDVVQPITLAEALILPGTQQWGAMEGCYCVQSMDSLDNPPTFCNTMGSILTGNELVWPNAGNAQDITSGIFGPIPVADVANNHVSTMHNFKTPFNKKGAIFSGLTPQSTFKVNRTTVIERFISSQDQNLAVLARMSPAEDYVALAFYSEIQKHLPIGAKFNDNGLGDWFLGIADGIADFVSGIGKPIMGAVAGYQNARAGGTPTAGAPKLIEGPKQVKTIKQQQKKLGAGRMKKSGAVVQGPRMPTGQFKSGAAKQIKAVKKAGK